MNIYRFPKAGQPAVSCYLTREFAAGINLNFTCGWFDITVPWFNLSVTW